MVTSESKRIKQLEQSLNELVDGLSQMCIAVTLRHFGAQPPDVSKACEKAWQLLGRDIKGEYEKLTRLVSTPQETAKAMAEARQKQMKPNGQKRVAAKSRVQAKAPVRKPTTSAKSRKGS